mmetsp:Transcript_4815/g.4952  ORF Transcript_4815/g.4952 Transcript_4815/m.4952 type:complete len:283 (+) Transcript_4815:105-953(+)
MISALLISFAAIKAHAELEIKFCENFEDITSDKLTDKPSSNSKEVWDEWALNNTKFSVLWYPSDDIIKANITSYHVQLQTNIGFVNRLLYFIGGFPQDLCSPKPGLLDHTATNGRRPKPCAVYNVKQGERRSTEFSIPSILQFIISHNHLTISARGYGTYKEINPMTNKYDDMSVEKSVTFWCFHLRGRKPQIEKEKEELNLEQSLSYPSDLTKQATTTTTTTSSDTTSDNNSNSDSGNKHVSSDSSDSSANSIDTNVEIDNANKLPESESISDTITQTDEL